MTGKVPRLEPRSSGQRTTKVVRQYWSPFFQKWITKSGNQSSGPSTPARQAVQGTFSATVKIIKQVSADDRVAAAALAKNTPFLDRDLLMKTASGLLFNWIDDDGVTWVGRRQVYPDIQAALDSIGMVEGGMLVRTSAGWLVLSPGAASQVLTMDADASLPFWDDPQGGDGGKNFEPYPSLPPLAASYTGVLNPHGISPAPSVIDGVKCVLIDTGAMQAGDSLQGVTKPCTSPTLFRWTVGMIISMAPGNYRSFGIGFSNGTAWHLFQLQYNGGIGLTVFAFTNPTTFFTTLINQQAVGIAPIFFRIENDGTDISFSISADGAGFVRVYHEPSSAWGSTITTFGLVGDCNANQLNAETQSTKATVFYEEIL